MTTTNEETTMTETPDTRTVFQRWLDAKAAIGAIAKEQETTGSAKFKYSFRGIDMVVNKVGPILEEHGLAVVPTKTEWDSYQFTDGKGNGVEMGRVAVTWRVFDATGDGFEMQTVGSASDYSDKALIQAGSVAWRIALLQGLTIRTDDNDPDNHHVERNDPGLDDAAKALGWQSEAQKAASWQAILGMDRELSEELREQFVKPWAQSAKLSPSTFTPTLRAEWEQQILKAQAPAEPEGEPQEQPRGDEEPGHDTRAWAGFGSLEEAQAANDDLMERSSVLAGAAGDELAKWREFEGIDRNNLTREQAREWYHRLATALGQTPEAPGKAKNFRNAEERNATYDSLLDRQGKLDDSVADPIGTWLVEATGGKKTGLTRAIAEDWQARIIEAELTAPF